MKQFITDNDELLELLQKKGVNIICDENMRMTISDEDAEKVGPIASEFGPGALNDYLIEDL